MAAIYHVTTKGEWEEAKRKGVYESPSLATEGFIHCSALEQVAGVRERYFKDQADLIVLTIDTERLQHPLRFELAPSVGEEFPHLYGPLNLDAVVDEVEVI